MSFFAPIDKDALKSFVEQRAVPFSTTNRSWVFDCPKCGKRKLYVEKTTGRCRCFHCQDDFRGRVDFILSKVYGIDVNELKALFFGIKKPGDGEELKLEFVDFWHQFDDFEEEKTEIETLPNEILWDPFYVNIDDTKAQEGVDYLEKRGIPLYIALQYGIRYSPAEKRVIFPVIIDNILRGWQGRYIRQTFGLTDSGKPYLIPKIKTQGLLNNVFMFQDRLKGDYCVLAEGPFDAIKCHLCGNNVASMGKYLSKAKKEYLLNSGIKRLYLGLDDDAMTDLMKTTRDLHSSIEIYRLRTPRGRQDLGESTFEEVYDEFKKAERITPLTNFVYFKQTSF